MSRTQAYGQQGQSRDGLAKAQDWIAMILAGLVTYVATPIFHEYSVPILADFTSTYYREGLIVPIYFLWWGIAAAAIYFFSNAVILAWVRIVFAKFFVRLFQ